MSTLKTNRIENLTTTDGGISINNSGQVGIGETTPTRQLHVADDANNDVATFINSDSTNGYGVNIRAGGTASGRYALRVANDSNTVVLQANADGRVGLGTDSPSAHIESEGNVSSTTQFSGFQGLRVQNANGAAFGVTADINFVAGTASDNRGAAIGVEYVSGSKNDLYFATSGGSVTSTDTLTERLRITSAGLVGLGTTSPQRDLHIHNADSSTNTYFQLTSATTGTGSTDGFQFWVYGGSSNKNAVIAQREDAAIEVWTNNTERMRVDGSGRLLVGLSTARTGFFNTSSITPHLQVETNGPSDNGRFMSLVSNPGESSGYTPTFLFGKSRSTSAGGTTLVVSGDELGAISWQGADGSHLAESARIAALVDSGTGANDIPGRLVFSTTADGAAAPTERMRITSGGYAKHTDNGSYYNSGASYHEFNQSIAAQNTVFNSTNSNFGATHVGLHVSRVATTAYWFLQGVSGSGSGSDDTEFYIRGDGNAYIDGSWNGGGADYAEYFEWSDGNTEAEDRRGISVVLDGDKIRKAVEGEEPIGVISGNPSVVGDADVDRWKGKYLRDDYGSYILNKEGYRQLNPDYDSSVEYVQRENRPEWDCVGLMGKLRIRKGQVTGSRWIKMRDISDSVEEWLVR